MPKQRRYWDSDIFFTWFKKEQGKYEKCRGIIQKAKNNEIEIVTSALTITEVLYLKGKDKIDRDKSDEICRFFELKAIIIVNLDRYLAENARNLVWDHNVKPKDAIHVATAIKAKVPVLDTFDEKLLKLNGELGDPPLRITIPDIPFQPNLIDEEK